MQFTTAPVKNILTRSSGYLKTVASHSLNPYRGCALGNSLCGVGCYVQHNWYLTRGQPWGSFVEARANAAEAYARTFEKEQLWARNHRGRFVIFMSSSTEPFQPAEQKFRVSQRVLEMMIQRPPDGLIVQSHSHHVADYLDLYRELSRQTVLRIHVSIETDREHLPGLPPSASSLKKRLEACQTLRAAGLRVIVAVSPLLPIENPGAFFASLAGVSDGVILDHFIGGDGSSDGSRTRRTALPVMMERVEARSVTLAYRDEMAEIARKYFPGRVGIGIDGFAGKLD